MTKYSELLRDPRWQKKRLEILDRDEFTCRRCGDTEATLHVHHCYYTKGNDPWDYPNGSLVTLCESCHEHETEYSYSAKQLLISTLSSRGLLSDRLVEAATALEDKHVFDVLTLAVCWHQLGLDTNALAEQVCNLYSAAAIAVRGETAHG